MLVAVGGSALWIHGQTLGLLAKDALRGRSDTKLFEMAFAWLTHHRSCLR